MKQGESVFLIISTSQFIFCHFPASPILQTSSGALMHIPTNARQERRHQSLLLAAVLGGLATLGWAPFAAWPATLVSYALLFFLLQSDMCRPLAVGFTFGLGLHLCGHGWVATAFYTKTGASLFSAMLGGLAFTAFLALFSAIPCAVWTTWMRRAYTSGIDALTPARWAACCTVFAALMTLGEWCRSLVFNGFTSLSVGYSLVDTWLAGFAPVTGTYGLSWMGYWISTMAAGVLLCRAFLRIALSFIAAVFVGGLFLAQVEWTTPQGDPLSFRLIQTGVTQEHKFLPQSINAQVDDILTTIEQERADLILTPETALPAFLNQLPAGILSRLRLFSAQTASHILLGVATFDADGRGFNSVLHIEPGTAQFERYDKVRLTPFGEYSPVGFDWFTQSLDIPLKDLTPGQENQPPLHVKKHRIGVLTCQEDSLGRDLHRWLPIAGILVNPSNLAWFEGSIAIAQRLQMARMRALESGRPILRAANTGVTAHIDHQGEIVDALEGSAPAVLRGHVQPMKGITPYGWWGDWSVILLCLCCLAAACLLSTTKRAVLYTPDLPDSALP